MKYLSLLLACSISLSLPLAAEPPATQPSPPMLLAGLGNHHHPVSTQNPDAQRFFDQGLTLIYAFNHDEAARSFRRAAELDPQLAIAWWGVALSLGPNINLPLDAERAKAAYDAAQKALSLSPHASEPEQAYIRAVAKRYSDNPTADRRPLDEAYAQAMGELSQRYPDDLDAATLSAESLMDLQPWSYWTADGKPLGNAEQIVATLESVLKRAPDHPGANHYYIHAVESSSHPARALASAARLPALVPAAGHLVHMPAHIYIRIGDYDAAVASNQAAIQADEAYLKMTDAHGVYPLMYYSHNIHFLAVASALQGQHAAALAAADKLLAHVSPHLQAMPMLEGFAVTPILIQIRFARWDELLNSPAPDPAQKVVTAMWHFGRGLASAATQQIPQAQAEHQAFLAAKAAIPADALYSEVNKAADVLAVAQPMLEAKIAWAQGDQPTALRRLHDAIHAEDQLRYMEPPDWYLSSRQALGNALLQTGDYAAAEQAFRADLDKHPRNGRSLFGLLQSLKGQDKDYAAQSIEPQVHQAWRNADTPLRIDIP